MAKRRSPSTSRRAKTNLVPLPETPGSPSPAGDPASKPFFWGIFVSIGVGLFLAHRGFRATGAVLFFWGIGLCFFPWLRSKPLAFLLGLGSVGSRIFSWIWSRPYWTLGAGWLLVCLGILSYFNMKYAVPHFLKLPFHEDEVVRPMALGCALLVFSFLKRRSEEVPDPEVWVSRVALGVILAVAALFRFYHLQDPLAHYWDDWAGEIVDVRRFLDYGDPQLIYPLGSREPFFNFFTAFVWWLLPDQTGLVVQRISAALLDLGTVINLYFLGKELRGRRTGVFAAGLGAISKPLVMKCLTGIHLIALPFAASLSLLMFFRVLRQPTFLRFWLFGTIVGGGIYTYSAFRPWLPFLVFCLLAWTLSRPGERPLDRFRWILVLGISAAILLIYLIVNPYLPPQHPLVRLVSNTWFQVLTGLVLLYSLLKASKGARAGHGGFKTLHWAACTLWAFLLAAPILFQPELTTRLGGLSIFYIEKGVDNDFVQRFLQSLWWTLRALFIAGQDRADFSISWDAVLDFPAEAVLYLGLAYFIARPSWKMFFLVLAAGVGFSPRVLSTDQHTGKILGSIVPVLLLAALGLEAFWRIFATRSKSVRMILGSFLVLAWSWGAQINFNRIYGQWAFEGPDSNPVLAVECTKLTATHRLYLGPYALRFASPQSQEVLQERNQVHNLRSDNPIYLTAGEEPRDLVVFLSNSDLANRDRIKKDFPGARWSELLRDPWQKPEELPDIGEVVIPGSQLEEKPGKLFYLSLVPSDLWSRTYFDGDYGIARGLIFQEDRVKDLAAPTPQGPGGSCRIRGIYHSPSGGKNIFSVTTQNGVRLCLDGREVLDLGPSPKARRASGSIRLRAGDHPVEMVVYFKWDGQIPGVRVRTPGGQEGPL